MALPMEQRNILSTALMSRFLVITLQIVLNNLVPDHGADAFHQEPLRTPGPLDHVVEVILGGFRKWDAAYFLHIAEQGYTQPNMAAFFPLLPCALRLLSGTLLYPLHSIMHARSVLLIAGCLINLCAFACAALVLYHLTRRVCRSQVLAYYAAVLFCFNPASVFMSAVYTEPVFCLLSLLGMWSLELRMYLSSAAMFALSTATRSNGTVTVGFVLYHMVQALVLQAWLRSRVWNLPNLTLFCRHLATAVTRVLYSVAIIILPFVLFQVFTYQASCVDSDVTVHTFIRMGREGISRLGKHLIMKGLNGELSAESGLSGELSAESGLSSELSAESALAGASRRGPVPGWCNKTFVIPYSEIQAEGWSVGFMAYYEVKQTPNFLLACPTIVLSLWGVWTYCTTNWTHVRHLGLLQPIGGDVKKTDVTGSQSDGFFHPDAFVYWVHLLVLLLFAVFFMHIQVITRFLCSSSPAVYWVTAHVILSSLKLEDGSSPRNENGSVHQELSPIDIVWRKKLSLDGRLLRGYFLGYCIVGVALHCNFLPWT